MNGTSSLMIVMTKILWFSIIGSEKNTFEGLMGNLQKKSNLFSNFI